MLLWTFRAEMNVSCEVAVTALGAVRFWYVTLVTLTVLFTYTLL